MFVYDVIITELFINPAKSYVVIQVNRLSNNPNAFISLTHLYRYLKLNTVYNRSMCYQKSLIYNLARFLIIFIISFFRKITMHSHNIMYYYQSCTIFQVFFIYFLQE